MVREAEHPSQNTCIKKKTAEIKDENSQELRGYGFAPQPCFRV
jgi:hypothetical protein